MLTNQYNRIVKDFYLLLVVYIHCFCLPIFSSVINIFGGFGESVEMNVVKGRVLDV